MGSIRIIIFALVVWLVWRMYKNYQVKKQQSSVQQNKILKDEKVVMCQFCSIHLPESKALSYEDNWFCSKQHQQQFLSDKN